MTGFELLGLLMVVFALGALGGFFFDKAIQAWYYVVDQVLFFPKSYHALKAENAAFMQELEYRRRDAGALRENVDRLMEKMKSNDSELSMLNELHCGLAQHKKIAEQSRRDLWHKSRDLEIELVQVRGELSAEYQRGDEQRQTIEALLKKPKHKANASCYKDLRKS